MASPDHTLAALFGPHSAPLGAHSHPCSYLPGLTATDEAWLSTAVNPAAYHELMNRGFRRSGHILYRPVCEACQACVPIRIPAATFALSRSQRRNLRRNRDVQVSVGMPELTQEKFDVYRRYLRHQHNDSNQGDDADSLREFLYSSCVRTLEFEYRDARGALLGVSIADFSRQSLSSVYHFFEPAHARRGIGVYSVLREIEWCRAGGVPWYYLGYWVQGCRTMEYKSRYRPCELLIDGRWQVQGDSQVRNHP